MTRTTLLLIALLTLAPSACQPATPTPARTRVAAIPARAVKVTPAMDPLPPVLHGSLWRAPVPLEGPVNTAGAEDSAFITPDGGTLYFFFTPDANVPPEKQLLDGVTGLWCARRAGGVWGEPARVILGKGPSLDGAAFVLGDELWFASVRAGNYREIDIYTARLQGGRWTDVRNAGRQLNEAYDIGELHIAPDGQALYCGGPEQWGAGQGKDLHVLYRTADGWTPPEALPAPINTPELDEDQPFITPDGNELWFTGQSRRGYPGPAVFRSLRAGEGCWSPPEEIVSSFAAEPTLDAQGNLYFVHHYIKDGRILEADIYVAYREG